MERPIQLAGNLRHVACNFPKVWKYKKLASSAYGLTLEIGGTWSPASSVTKEHVDFGHIFHISTCKVT